MKSLWCKPMPCRSVAVVVTARFSLLCVFFAASAWSGHVLFWCFSFGLVLQTYLTKAIKKKKRAEVGGGGRMLRYNKVNSLLQQHALRYANAQSKEKLGFPAFFLSCSGEGVEAKHLAPL
jgi:hypothetical protein